MAAKNNNYDQWLLEGESQTLEFKTSFDKTTVESLVAFANAQGGIVLTFAQVKVEQSASSESAGQVTGQVTPDIARMLGILKGEMSRQQLQDALDLNSRDNFDKRYLKPAIELKLIEPTIPEKPNSRLQKYRLTQAGQAQQLDQKAKHK